MIELSERNGVAIVTLAHGKANALDTEFCDAIAARLNELQVSPARAVVITGQGTIFSAGVNLLRLSAGGPDYVRQFLPALHRLYEKAFFFPKPMVAAVNGHAIAGGCVLAACADRRLMRGDSGRIGVTELQVGVPFPVMAFEVMRYAVTPQHLAEVMIAAATYAPPQALERGLIDEIVAPELLLEQALAAANAMAALSPAAFALTKRRLREPVAERVRQGRDYDQAVTKAWTTPETLRFIRAYVARTLKK